MAATSPSLGQEISDMAGFRGVRGPLNFALAALLCTAVPCCSSASEPRDLRLIDGDESTKTNSEDGAEGTEGEGDADSGDGDDGTKTWHPDSGATPNSDGEGGESGGDADSEAGDDGGASSDGGDDAGARPCGGVALDPEETERDLQLDACVQISPELEDEIPDKDIDRQLLVDPETGLSHRRCAYFNLIGGTGVSREDDLARVWYCDNDIGGGLRLATIDLKSGEVSTTLSRSGDCWPSLSTGTLIPTEEGLDGYFVYLNLDDSHDDVVTGLWRVRMDSDGEVLTGPELVSPGLSHAYRFQFLSDRLVNLGEFGDLSVATIDDDRVVSSAPEQLLEDIDTFAAVERPDGALWLATCDKQDGVAFHRYSEGQLDSEPITGGVCVFDGHIRLVEGGEHGLMAWHDGERGYLRFLDNSGAEQQAVALEPGSVYPAPHWTGRHYLVVDGSGEVSQWSPEGELLASHRHPLIAVRQGEILNIAVWTAENTATFAVVGSDRAPLPTGHEIVWNWLELSRATMPGQ